MIFRRSKPDPLQEIGNALGNLKPTPEEELALALRRYEDSFASGLTRHEDPEIESAKTTLSKAKKLVSESGLGLALAPTLIHEVEHWPSWSTRDDFENHKHFPATDVYGTSETDKKLRTVTKVYFRYNTNQYGLILRDDGFNTGFGDDPFHHGAVEFIAEDQIVLGLDISRSTKHDISNWTWFNLHAFRSGSWMKELLEMAAHIDAGNAKFMNEIENEDILSRAKNIKL